MDDRRKFLKQSGAALGGFLINPAAGLLGVFAAGAVPSKKETPQELPYRWQPLLRSGSPINGAGHAFGGRLSSLTAFQSPQALQKEEVGGRYVVVATHSSPREGISIFEVVKTKRGWDHVVSGRTNRVFSRQTSVPLDGGCLVSGGSLFRHQALLDGVGSVACSATTPWRTVLCAESPSVTAGENAGVDNSGWVVEVNPLTGVAVKRLSLARVQAVGLVTVSEPARRYVVYMLGGPSSEQMYLYKFVSHQRLDAMRFDANSQMLLIGQLSVADLEKHEWITLTANLSGEKWLQVMSAPAEAAAQVVAPVRGAHALTGDGLGLALVCDAEVIRLTEKNGAWESKSFETAVEPGSPEKYSISQLKPLSFTLRVEGSGADALVLGVEHEGSDAIVSVRAALVER